MAIALRCMRVPCPLEPRFSLMPGSYARACFSTSQLLLSDADGKGAPNKPRPKLSRETVRKNVEGYVFGRYIDMVKNYDKILEKNFPSAVKVYRVFFDGVKDFYADMKRYMKISRIANSSPNGLRALNRKELELYMQMPRDMVKVAPALIGSSLPMVGYAIFPLVFMYPRTLLTSHFWTLQQKAEFQQLQMRERLSYNRSVFRLLQAKLHAFRRNELNAELSRILGLLGSGFHPTVDSILNVKDAFAKPPYSLFSLASKHVKLLSQMHGLSGTWFRVHRLREHAFLVHHMDLAIGREGGVHNMSSDAIRYACYLRGLNPANLSNEEMIEWLRNWIKVSTSIQEEHISLFLHLPLFLAYNHPNNWLLIYGDNTASKATTTQAKTQAPNSKDYISDTTLSTQKRPLDALRQSTDNNVLADKIQAQAPKTMQQQEAGLKQQQRQL